ncbi:diuretic hormone receptor [Caerostris extrusa]|uniref:Diuretic hormone receptor n=1 Tax=Caerostris extrusa TaxID=172846 RepID=A0AAV4XRC8_CAEEX|nr:diuretic hormone receptor [Caerostris extrusa]
MLDEAEFSVKSTFNVTTERNAFQDIGSFEELDCISQFLTAPYPGNGKDLYCNSTWDGVSCWPTTASGSTANVPCFEEFNGVKYDTATNASRQCLENGTWSPWSNYRECKPLTLPEDDEFYQVLWDMKEAATIYYVGYGISLVALSLALFVFFFTSKT